METKFTEGNWIVKQNQEFPTLHEIWSGENRGEVPTFIAKTCYAPRSEANANLISAAPDLFEACERALQVLNDENIWGQSRLLIVAAMRKAIGK